MNVFDVLREKFETKKVAAIQNQKHFNDKDLEETVLVCEAISAAFGSAIKTVNRVEQEYNNGWIPVSERFPIGKETHKVLVTDKDGIMAVCYFLEVTKVFKVTWDGEEFQGVIAWQPLPAPFRDDVPRKQTNADRIRSMSDEELAMNMMCPNENGLGEIECNKNDSCNCYECILDWLQKEVDA